MYNVLHVHGIEMKIRSRRKSDCFQKITVNGVQLARLGTCEFLHVFPKRLNTQLLLVSLTNIHSGTLTHTYAYIQTIRCTMLNSKLQRCSFILLLRH